MLFLSRTSNFPLHLMPGQKLHPGLPSTCETIKLDTNYDGSEFVRLLELGETVQSQAWCELGMPSVV